MEANHILLIAGVAILGIVIVVLARRHEKRRAEEMKRRGRREGFTYEEKSPDLLDGGFTGLHLFRQGHSKRARNVLRGSVGGRDAIVFDYHYTTGGGQHSSHHAQMVAVFALAESALPEFELRPENVFHKIGSAFGYQDLDFDANPEFSKRYVLRGPDESALRRHFARPLLRFFEKHRGWSVECGGGWLVAYRHRKRVRPAELRKFVRECGELVKTVTAA
jgi:hypothetical protein